MFNLSKRQLITLFCGTLLAFPILVQAAAPPLMVCGGIILIEEDEVSETPPAIETPIIKGQRF